jgi:hypothetical protein
LSAEVERLQQELASTQTEAAHFKQQLKDAQDALKNLQEASRNTDTNKSQSKFVAFEEDAGVFTIPPEQAEGGFEPEPDSLNYLDLATEKRVSGDYFVEEAETTKSPSRSRTKSTPSDWFVEEEEDNLHGLPSPSQGYGAQSYGDTADSGRFEPEEDVDGLHDADGLQDSLTALPLTLPEVVDEGFQLDSLTFTLDSQPYPPASAPNTSFLPDPDGLHASPAHSPSYNPAHSPSHSPASSRYVHLMGPDTQDQHSETTLQIREMREVENAAISAEQSHSSTVADNASPAEAEFERRLKSELERLEEVWVQKMRTQEVELCLEHERKFRDFKEQTEQWYQHQVQQVRRDTQASFVEAVRDMRHSLERQQQSEAKEEQKRTKALKQRLLGKAKPGKSGKKKAAAQPNEKEREPEDQQKLDEIVKQLSAENKVMLPIVA